MARWEGELDQAKLEAALSGNALPLVEDKFEPVVRDMSVAGIRKEALGSVGG